MVGLDAGLLKIVALSLGVSAAATAAASLVGAAAGRDAGHLPVSRAAGAGGAGLLANALLGLPPVVVGLGLYLLLSRAGPLGWMELLFTPGAMVLAQFLLALPIVAALAHRAADGIWRTYGDDLRINGAGAVPSILTVLAIGRAEMLTAVLTGFGRTISEVGAIWVVGGNIAGHTRTMTTSIVLETSRGNLGFALALGGVLVAASLAVSVAAFAIAGRAGRAGAIRLALFAALAIIGSAGAARAQAPFITVASTTSTEQSGLFEHLLPAFTRTTGIVVRVVAVGTGQALKLGERGDADVVLVHDAPSELRFVAEGWGIERREVMYNDFIVAGPKQDPAGIVGSADTVASFRRIAEARAPFVTRGDDSGTHKSELRFWAEAGLDPKALSAEAAAGRGASGSASGSWYRDIGGGMGPALNMAAAIDGYTLTDRGTWLSFQNRRNLVIAVQGDRRLFNQYGVMLVNPARHPSVKAELGRVFIEWLVSAPGQQAIAAYKIGGAQLFFPNAGQSGS